jgi:hypothetical protein
MGYGWMMNLTCFSVVGFVFILLASLVENGTFWFVSELLIDFSSSVTSIAFLVVPKMYFVYRFKKTGEMPTGLQRGRTRVSGLAPPTTNRPGASSHITFNHGVNPSSMPSSGISGVSSLSQSDYGNQSLSRFGSFRLSKASQNIPGVSPRNAPNAAPSSFSRPESSSLALSSQQESPTLSKVMMISHTGIPSPPLGMDVSKPDTTSRAPVAERSGQSIEPHTASPSTCGNTVPDPPLDTTMSITQESPDRQLPSSETAPGPLTTGRTPLPRLSDQEVVNDTITERNPEEEKRKMLAAKLTNEVQGAIEESTDTIKA